MIAVSHKDLKRWLWSCLCSTAMIPCLILSARGQQIDPLQQQLQQLKQQHEATTHDLEQRIAALEQQIEKEKVAREQQVEKQKEDNAKAKHATGLAAELPTEQTVRKAMLGNSNEVGGRFQGTVPSEPRWTKLNVVVQWLKANGLTRLLKRNDWPRYVETEPEIYSSQGGECCDC